MANMSYCRYRNTLRDLDDCAADLELRVFGGTDEDDEEVTPRPLSREEHKAALDLVIKALDIARLFADNWGINDLEQLQDRIENRGLDIE